jgi:hypothetical protein
MVNDLPAGNGRLPFAAAFPAGAGRGPARLLTAILEAVGPDTRPARDIRLEFRSLAGVSPDFHTLTGRLSVLPTQVAVMPR